MSSNKEPKTAKQIKSLRTIVIYTNALGNMWEGYTEEHPSCVKDNKMLEIYPASSFEKTFSQFHYLRSDVKYISTDRIIEAEFA
jgi:hypothetical protein